MRRRTSVATTIGLALAATLAVYCGHVRAAAPGADEPDGEVVLTGLVQGPDDRPVPEARLFLIGANPAIQPEDIRSAQAPPVRAMTGRDGKFRIPLSRTEASQARPDMVYIVAAPPVRPAAGEALGIAWNHAIVFDSSGTWRRKVPEADSAWHEWFAARQKAGLRLPKDDIPLTGHVREANGRPVGGATVRVAEIWEMKGRDLTGWINAVVQGQADYDSARDEFLEDRMGSIFDRHSALSRLLVAKTDQAGAFRLSGIGRERLINLAIGGPGIAVSSENVYARTRPGPRLDILHDRAGGSEEFTYYGARLEYVARPSTAVTGVVTDLETGRTLAGVVVRSHKLAGMPNVGLPAAVLRAVTDSQGRYRLEGMPDGPDGQVLAIVYDQPYLPSARPVATGHGQKEVRLDFGLRRGTWIRGRVTDAKTGRPVPCCMQYFAPLDNPNRESAQGLAGAADSPFGSYPTDREGRFAVPALPGRGIFTALASDDNYKYPHGAGAEGITGSANGSKGKFAYFPAEPSTVVAFTYNALAQVEIPANTEEITRDIKLDPGTTLRGDVLDPGGRALPGAIFAGAHPEGFLYTPVPKEGFKVDVYQPDRPRLILVVHKGRKLAGGVIVRGPQEGRLRVTLQPWGVVTGRVLDGEGRPRTDLTLVNPGRGEHDAPEEMSELPERYYVTDKDGRFRIEGLAAGVPYKLVTRDGFKQVFSGVTLGPGESKDLGDVPVE